ncbi:MAG: NADH-quinone oxidoreductase subunit L [Elusimicrobiota bacterium]
MNYKLLILITIFAPLAGSVLLPLISKISEKARNLFALCFALAALVCSASLIPAVISGQTITITRQLPFGFNFVLHADMLAVFMATVSSLVSSIIIIYSFGYISHYKYRDEYYLMVDMFLGAMMGICFSANLILLYVFWEITAITSWRLIGFFRTKDYMLKADKAFLVTVFGALMMLIGFILMYSQAGTFDLQQLKEFYSVNPLPSLAVGLILLGILSKSATLPLHTWLPDAGVAPSPVTALLHAAVLVKIGVYVFARLFIATLPLSADWQMTVMIIGGVSAIVSAGAAFIETDMKRIIAYSTVSQIGFIFLGLASGSPMGIAGAMLYILMHAFSKGGLFLCAGIIEQNTKTKDITALGGLFKTMPVTAVVFLISAFSVMGIPPLGGFFGKYMVISGTVAAKHPVIAAMYVFIAFLTILYLFRLFILIFMGEAKKPAPEKSPIMIASIVSLAVLSVAGGILISFPSSYVGLAVQQMIGIMK